ncbi:hypothetical protein BH09PAT1_BH09PAT1_1120 [soil metagenome]
MGERLYFRTRTKGKVMIDWIGSVKEPTPEFQQIVGRMEAFLHAFPFNSQLSALNAATGMMAILHDEFRFQGFDQRRGEVIAALTNCLHGHMFTLTHKLPGCDLGSSVTLRYLVREFDLIPANLGQ